MRLLLTLLLLLILHLLFAQDPVVQLNPVYQARLFKHVISTSDPTHTYVGDGDRSELYYHALIPEGELRGGLVLLPGTWETTEHAISSTQALCEQAFDHGLAVFVLSINQRITLTDTMLSLINTMLKDALLRYQVPGDKIVMGGFSMGGLFSLRYAEYAKEDARKTVIVPAAVFSCDGPTDLVKLHRDFIRKLNYHPNATEPAYGIREMERYCGGTPETALEAYELYSCHSYHREDGGNARFLTDLPVRIYCDVDPNWWLDNRMVDMHDMNALDHTALILRLRRSGNTKAEFINAFGKGYRIEGHRHPHSWSIIDPAECIQWINRVLFSN